MAGKTVENRGPTTVEELKAKVAEKYKGVVFEHPYGYGRMEVARLKRHERAKIREATFHYAADGTVIRIDDELQNRMAAAYGLIAPKLAETPEQVIEDLREYPDDFVEGIAQKVWEISNDYRDTAAATNGKGGAESAPFFPKNSSVGDSPPSSDGPSTT